MAYDFNDASSHDINYGDVTFLDGLTTFSGHIWVNLDDVASDHYLLSKNDQVNDILLWLFDDVSSVSGRTDTFTIFIRIAGTTVRVDGATNAASAGSWQPVGFSVDVGVGGVLNLWIDGTKDANSGSGASSLGAWINKTSDLTVGSNAGAAFMDGQIAEPVFWNRVLTDAEFVALSKGVSPLNLPQGLLFHPPLIRDPDDVVGGVTGTVTGATVTSHPRIIRPSRQILQFPPVAAGDLSLTPGVVSLDIAAQVAVANLTRNLAPALATLDIATQAATVQLVREINATLATLNIAPQTLVANITRELVPALVTLDIAAINPSTSGGLTLLPIAAALSIVAQTPVVNSTRNLAPSTVALDIARQAATVQRVREIVSLLVALNIQGFNPVVTLAGEIGVAALARYIGALHLIKGL